MKKHFYYLSPIETNKLNYHLWLVLPTLAILVDKIDNTISDSLAIGKEASKFQIQQ